MLHHVRFDFWRVQYLGNAKKEENKNRQHAPPSSSGPMTALLFAMPVGLSLP